MNFKKTIALFFLCLVMLATHGQSDTLVVRPGSDHIDGSVIKPYTNRWKVTYITGDGKEIPNKIWTDYGQIMELDGKSYFHRVQDLYDPKMTLQDTWINMVELKTLQPVSFSSLKPSGAFAHYQFDENKVTGKAKVKPDQESVVDINIELPEAVFDWNLYGMLLVGLPLKEGLIAKLPYYAAQSDSLQWLTVSVLSKDKLELPSGEPIDTYKIATNLNLTFWVSKSAPYVIKLEYTLQNNAMLLWEMY